MSLTMPKVLVGFSEWAISKPFSQKTKAINCNPLNDATFDAVKVNYVMTRSLGPNGISIEQHMLPSSSLFDQPAVAICNWGRNAKENFSFVPSKVFLASQIHNHVKTRTSTRP